MSPRMFVQTMITLASASLGLIAALAWNEATRATLRQPLREDDSLVGLYTHAILATVLAVLVLLALARAASRIGGEAAFSHEAESYAAPRRRGRRASHAREKWPGVVLRGKSTPLGRRGGDNTCLGHYTDARHDVRARRACG